MPEPQRSRYLSAIGVDVYVSRHALPAAAPTVMEEWEAYSGAAEDMVAGADAPTRSVEPASAAVVAGSISDLVVDVPRQARRDGEVVDVARSAAVAEIRLLVALSENGSLIIDDLPGSAERPHCLRLLGNMVFAMERGGSSLNADAFEWPLSGVRNRQLARDEQAARETLHAFVAKKLQRAPAAVYLLGDRAAYWLDEPLRKELGAERSLRWRLSVSAQAVLRDSRLKQRWWVDLRTGQS